MKFFTQHKNIKPIYLYIPSLPQNLKILVCGRQVNWFIWFSNLLLLFYIYIYIILTVNAVEIDIKYKTYSNNNNNNNIMQAYNSQNYRNEFLKLARYAYLLYDIKISKIKKLNLLDFEQRMYFFIWCLHVYIINLCSKEK